MHNKTFDVKADLDYHDADKEIAISPSILSLGDNSFEVSGSYHFKEKNMMDMRIVGKDTDLQSLLALLPESTSARYKSIGVKVTSISTHISRVRSARERALSSQSLSVSVT